MRFSDEQLSREKVFRDPIHGQIIVDNHASRENTTRYAQHQGYQVSVSEQYGEWTLTFTK